MYKDLFHSSRGGIHDEAIIMDGMETFEKELAQRGGRYFGGPHKPGMLDYMIWPWCERADLLKLVGRAFTLKKDKFKKLVSCKSYKLVGSLVLKLKILNSQNTSS